MSSLLRTFPAVAILGARQIEIKLGRAVLEVRALETCVRDLGLRRALVCNLAPGLTEIRRGVWMGGLLPILDHLRLLPPVRPTRRSMPSRRRPG